MDWIPRYIKMYLFYIEVTFVADYSNVTVQLEQSGSDTKK